jgi:hypothetical protein
VNPDPEIGLQCNQALPLVAAYLDGELSEAQAAPLRKHLLDCVACRGSAQDLKNLKRWLAPAAEESHDVPDGFAARVARRAFAGDRGIAAAVEQPRGELLTFVRELTAVAAALLLILAIGLQLARRPAGEALLADEVPTLAEIESELARLNEAAGAEAGLELEAPEVVDGERD